MNLDQKANYLFNECLDAVEGIAFLLADNPNKKDRTNYVGALAGIALSVVLANGE